MEDNKQAPKSNTPNEGPVSSSGNVGQTNEEKKAVQDKLNQVKSGSSATQPDSKSQPKADEPMARKKGNIDSSQVIKSKTARKESLSQSLGSWLVPIIAVVVMGLPSVFVLLPAATDALDCLDEIRLINTQIDRNDQKIEALQSLSLTEVNSALQIATSVIKDDLKVAELAGDVEAMASDNSLETQSVQFSSTLVGTADIPGFVEVISGPFSYRGEFNDISDFLSDLRTKSPTILAIRSVSLDNESKLAVGTEEEPVWSVDLVVDAYTMGKIDTVSIMDSVSSVIDAELMTEIEERASYGETLD